MQEINSILKEYWGFDSFRDMQPEIIQSVLAGKDTLALLPTGGGKSICFQVPAMANEGICLVISPLIALMKDQVENLAKKGIPALAIYSGMSFIETKRTLENAIHGRFKFLYVSPERLETNLFLEYLPSFKINLLAIDEAHCISQWGYDFRPPYLRIANLREELPGVPILALTASATKEVQDDICDKLLFGKDQQRFQKSFERPNLSYSVFNVASKQNKLLEVIKNVKGSGIVYCKTRKHTREVADLLKLHGVVADFYHAGLSNNERNRKQQDWVSNRTRIIVSTNAFGMGIDKPDVRVVVHYDVPDCLENYYQEAGRAGRDEKRAYAVLLYNHKELEELNQQIQIRFPKEEDVKKVYAALSNYLQVPAWSGEGISFDLDITEFVSRFSLDMMIAAYSIKVLEQEGLLSFNEVFFKPSTLVFNTDKKSLLDFEQLHPALEPLIKGLLRSYEGIFDFPTVVNETQLSKFLKMEMSVLKKELRELSGYGVIDYVPQKEKPQVTFLQRRLPANDFKLNVADYGKRKDQYANRINELMNYINTTDECRSQLIGNYFNDNGINPCGICDCCINNNNEAIFKEEFNDIATNIMEVIKQENITAGILISQVANIKKSKLWKVLNYLQAEKKITVTKEGIIKKN